MSKELLKNNESEINTSDNHIINIVTDKINNLDTKNDLDTNEQVIHYSNEDIVLEVKPEEKTNENILTKPKENILTEKLNTKGSKIKILPKQIIYGKK